MVVRHDRRFRSRLVGSLGPANQFISVLENPRRFFHSDAMNRLGVLLWLLAASAGMSGCGKPAVVEVSLPAISVDDFLPKHAQAKLPTMKIFLGAEQLDAELALTAQQEMTGMMYRTNIQETDAMLFVLPGPRRASFWMKNCPESLSAAYMDSDGTILEIHHLEKNDTNAVVAATENIRFVLETKEGWFGRHNLNTGVVVRTERGSLAETFLNRQ
jgi:uncharacterized membrane protein (UPF0127 family)